MKYGIGTLLKRNDTPSFFTAENEIGIVVKYGEVFYHISMLQDAFKLYATEEDVEKLFGILFAVKG